MLPILMLLATMMAYVVQLAASLLQSQDLHCSMMDELRHLIVGEFCTLW
jgi:hypothetical protein